MMNREVIYERTVTGSYMKIPVGINAGLDERLMLKRKLAGTLPVEKTYVDGSGQYWYNISGKQSLDTYCRVKEIGIAFVEKLAVSICSELDILEWNLVQKNCLVLDPELIFITNANQEFIFTLYPGNNAQIELEFQQLMEYLLTKINHKDEAAVRAAYGIYEMTLEEGYSILDIRETIMRAKQREIAEEADRRLEAESRETGWGRGSVRSAGTREARRSVDTEARETGIAEAKDVRRDVYNEIKHTDAARDEVRAEVKNVRRRERGMVKGAERKICVRGNAQKQKAYVKETGIRSKREAEKSETIKRKGVLERIWDYVKKQLGYEMESSANSTDTRPGEFNAGYPGAGNAGSRRQVQKPAIHDNLVYPEEEIYEPREEIHPTVYLGNAQSKPQGILLYQGVERLEDIRLDSPTVRIGYGADADVRIEHETISQMHARIDWDGDNYYIEDLNSTNGTYVNDELLAYKERRQLKASDVVRFANLRYRFC